MNDHDITAAVKTANDAHMGVIGIEYQISRLGVAPINGSAVAVLGSSPAAVANDVLSAALVVERPIHHSRTIQSEGPHSAGGGTALGSNLHRHSPAAVPANNQ